MSAFSRIQAGGCDMLEVDYSAVGFVNSFEKTRRQGEPIMQAVKQDALEVISQLPDTADMEEIMYRLYVLDKVRKGQDDIEQGRLTPAEDLKHEIEQW